LQGVAANDAEQQEHTQQNRFNFQVHYKTPYPTLEKVGHISQLRCHF
jgi:hypothetical protein